MAYRLYGEERADNMNFLSRLKGALSILFNKNDAAKKLGVSAGTSRDMDNAVMLWAKLYADSAPWSSGDVKSLNLPYSIAHEMARLATLEMSSDLTGSQRAEYLSEHYARVVESAPEWVEYACALGGVILKPYITKKGFAVDYVRADAFTPCAFDSAGNITACIFTERLKNDGKRYTRLEYHEVTDSGYLLRNKAYVSDSGESIGKEIALGDVAEWAELPGEAILPTVIRPLYSYMRIPGGNVVDRCSPLGCSVYNPAISVIEEIDRQYSRLLWEFEGSELAIVIDETMIEGNGKGLPKLNRRLFRGIESAQDGFYQPFSPTIREQSLINGLNELLRRMEFLCGLAYGTFSNVAETDKTATEIKSSKQRSYASVSAIQRSIKRALIDYAEVLGIICDIYSLVPVGKVEQSFDFDDSLITDSESEQKIWLQEVSAGLMKPETYIMKRYGVTEDQARLLLPDNAFGDI